MTPKQVDVQDFSIAGVAAKTSRATRDQVGARLMAQLNAPGFLDGITDVLDPQTLYSVHANWSEETQTYTQIFGVKVQGDGVYSEDVLRVHILGAPYTVFTAVGPSLPKATAETWAQIAAYRAKPNWRVTGTVSFEVYGPRSRLATPEVDIYVPGVLVT